MGRYDHVKYDRLPEKFHESFRMYIEEGYMPGGFLTAILEGNLFETVGAADSFNEELITVIVRWVYNEAPSLCWGNPEKVRAWHERYFPPKDRVAGERLT